MDNFARETGDCAREADNSTRETDDFAREQSLIRRFGQLDTEVLGELSSILRLYKMDVEDLFFKWESYSMRLKIDDTHIKLETARELKKYVQEQVEKEMKSRIRMHGTSEKSFSKVGMGSRRVGTDDVFGLLTSSKGTGTAGFKRKVPDKGSHETPKKVIRFTGTNSPGGALNSSSLPIRSSIQDVNGQNITIIPFSKRADSGTTIEILNEHIPKPELPLPDYPSYRDRVSLANTDVKNFEYKQMLQQLSKSCVILDKKIEKTIEYLQEYLHISSEDIRDPAALSTSEIFAVGRIVSDAPEGKINAASVVLESCRGIGAGSRVPLALGEVPSYAFFPGQIVALRGVNPGGKCFTVKEILDVPALGEPVTPASTLQEFSARLSSGSLNLMIASGPYTPDDNLLFESLSEICQQASKTRPDILILMGPFIDLEHPLISSGDFDLDHPESAMDGGSLEDLFRERITPKIKQVKDSMVILLPSTRDAVSKHVSYPQRALEGKPLQLPVNVKCLPNPAIFSLNDVLFGASTNDILFHLCREEIQKFHPIQNVFARTFKHVIQQKNFYPLFPPPSKEQLPKGVGTPNLHIQQLGLADFVNATPDVLVLPSQLTAFAKIVDSVVCINPGYISKKQSPGTYVTMTILPRTFSPEEKEELNRHSDDKPEFELTHKVYERARVDVLRI